MIRISLAFDKKIAKELNDYLTNLEIDCKLEDSEIIVDKADFDEKVLAIFLEKTNRTQYVLQKIDKNSFLISKIRTVEELGLGTCEICGLVATKDKLYSHRWTHGV